jgi:hypothetical protein
MYVEAANVKERVNSACKFAMIQRVWNCCKWRFHSMCRTIELPTLPKFRSESLRYMKRTVNTLCRVGSTGMPQRTTTLSRTDRVSTTRACWRLSTLAFTRQTSIMLNSSELSKKSLNDTPKTNWLLRVPKSSTSELSYFSWPTMTKLGQMLPWKSIQTMIQLSTKLGNISSALLSLRVWRRKIAHFSQMNGKLWLT